MKRRDALKLLIPTAIGVAAMSAKGMKLSDLKKMADELPADESQPALFLGHGNPMNALYDNSFTQKLSSIGQTISKPKAALIISAHWLTRGSYVSSTPHPETIYDFGGFPPELYKVVYPAQGSPENAKLVQETIKKTMVHIDDSMGLDHGAWSVLKHLWPLADVPVFQLSIDFYQSPRWHYELAQELRSLRKKGIMIIGSGNITHNLRLANFEPATDKADDWALEFDESVKTKILSRDHDGLIDYLKMGKAAQLAVPTNDHYLPLLYTLGLQEKNENSSFLYEGFQNSNISMRCVRIG